MPPHTAVERPACGPAPEAMPSAMESESETIATVTAAGRFRCTASRSGMRPSVVSTVMKREPDSEVSSEEVSDSSSRSPSFLVPRDIDCVAAATRSAVQVIVGCGGGKVLDI